MTLNNIKTIVYNSSLYGGRTTWGSTDNFLLDWTGEKRKTTGGRRKKVKLKFMKAEKMKREPVFTAKRAKEFIKNL